MESDNDGISVVPAEWMRANKLRVIPHKMEGHESRNYSTAVFLLNMQFLQI